MKFKIMAGYAAVFIAAGISTASGMQQWDCKYHDADVGGPGPDFPFKLIENATSLDAYLDDYAGTASRYKIIRNSGDGIIAIISGETGHVPSLRAFLLDKRSGVMKMTLTLAGTYEESYFGTCVRSRK